MCVRQTHSESRVNKSPVNISTPVHVSVYCCCFLFIASFASGTGKRSDKQKTTIRYGTKAEFNVHRKADCGQLNLAHVAKNKKYKKAMLSQRWPRDARYINRSWAVAEIWPFEPEIAPLDPPSPKTPRQNKTWSGSDDRLRRYRHLKFFQRGGGRHLGFVRIVNSAVRSAVPENPTLEPNMKWIGSPVAEIWPFAYVGGIWNPHFGGKGRS